MADANRIAAALRYQQGMALPTPEPDSMVGRALDAAAQWGRGVQKNVSDLVSPTAWAESLKNPPRGVLSQMNPENKQEMINQGIDSALNFGPAMLGKIVYHGSPHRFQPTANNPLGEFDPMKIGTGEGAQAYGVGAAYLAEAKGLAKNYKDTLAHKGALDLEYESNKLGIPLNREAQREFMRQSIPDVLPEKAAKSFQNANIEARNFDQNKLAELFKAYKESKQGNLYTVDLPDEHIAKMLDWDKPLSQQTSQEMKDAFNGIIKKYPELKEKFVQAYQDKQPGNIYYSILNDYRKSGDLTKNQLFASDVLREAGIPGIKYLDASSRGAPIPNISKYQNKIAALEAKVKLNPSEANKSLLSDAMQELQSMQRAANEVTSNFVVFDPAHMKIIGRE